MVHKIKTFVVALALLALSFSAHAQQVTQQATTGLVAPGLSGTGVPSASIVCNIASVNTQYIQTDGVAGSRLWICENLAGTYSWENLKGPVATGTTAAINPGLLTLGGCTTTTATIPGATVGTNAALAAPFNLPTSIPGTAGLANITAYVSAANTVTVSVCAIGALTTAATSYKVLLY